MKARILGIIAILCVCSVFMFGFEDGYASSGHGTVDTPLASISVDANTFLGDATTTTYDPWYIEPYGTVSISPYTNTPAGMTVKAISLSGTGSEYLTLDNNNAVSGTIETDVADISITVQKYVRGEGTTLIINKIIIPSEYDHSIVYDANGGSYDGVPPAEGWITSVTDYNSGYTNVTLRMCPFYNSGYDFIGWSIDGTVYQPGETYPVSGNDSVTAYAQWGRLYKHTVTYNGNGGDPSYTIPDSVRYTPTSGFADVTLIQNPYVKAGQSFTGWSVNGVKYLPGESVPVDEDATVLAVAQWESNSSTTYTHTITYDAGTGTGTMSPTVLTDHIDGHSYVTLANNTFTHAGYVFTGWQIGSTMYAEGVGVPVEAGISLLATAQWRASPGTDWTHTITYDLNGGVGNVSDTSVTDKLSIPTAVPLTTTTPLKTGFTFIGWIITGGEYIQYDASYSTYNGELIKVIEMDTMGNPLPAPTILVRGGDTVTAVAQWRDNSQYTHAISYNAGGGSGTMLNSYVTDNYRGYSYVPLSSNEFLRDNYNFVGWSVNGTLYNPGDLVPVLGNSTLMATAQWTEYPKYPRTITYNANGGSGTMTDTVEETYYSGYSYVPLSSCGFTREGYVFTGWDVNGTTYQPGDSVLVMNNHTETAYAQWEEVVIPTYIHSISYRSNGGSGSMQDTSETNTNSGNTLLTLAPCGFTRTGFNFTGWLIDGTVYQPYEQIAVAGDDTKIATAQWLVIQYTHTITYNANGGSGTMTDTVVTDTNSGSSNVYFASCGFTKTGFAFIEWRVVIGSTAYGYQPGDYIPVAGNSTITATAVWGTYTHTIKYNANEGTGMMADTVVTDTVKGNTNVTLSANGFTRSGYNFLGWSLNSASTSELYQAGDTLPVTGNSSRTVYAMWDPILYTHTIIYDANGGSGTMTNSVVTDMVSGTTNVPLAPNGYTRNGYDFMGWSVNGTTYQPGATIPITGNSSVTAIAVWSYTYTHTLTYNANGGSGTMTDTVVRDYNSSAVNITLLPSGYTLAGSNFIGWLVNGNVLQPGTAVPVAGDTTVTATAQWDVITYRHAISYNSNNGSGTMADTEVIDTNSGDTNVTLAQNGFTRTGYNFVGWLVNNNVLQPGQTVAVTGDSSVTAVAQWTLAEYTHTITYNANGGSGTMADTVVTDNNIGNTYVILSSNTFTYTPYDIHGIQVEYAFTGWSVNNVIYQAGQSVEVAGDSTVTAIAQWELITYDHTITYRPNGGSGTMANTVVTNAYSSNTNVPLASNGFTRTGYDFTGWLVDGTVYQPTETISIAGDTTKIATAQWIEIVYTHTIVYDANGGSGAMGNTVITDNVSGVTYVSLDNNEFSRTGYIFTGWEVNGDIYQPGDPVAVGGNHFETAYAQWSENVLPTYYHTIQYNSNGGMGYMTDTTIINTVSGVTNVPLATCVFIKMGYDFAGWKVNGTDYSEGDLVPVTGDSSVTAIAQWELSTYTHTIRYMSNGGTGAMPNTVVTNNTMGNTLIPLAPCGFSKTGYDFAGWECDDIIYQPGQSIPVAGNMSVDVYAQWTEITYTHTIAYNPNGASGTMQNTVVTDTNSGDTAVSLSPNGFTYMGYTFKGWNVGGTIYQPGQTLLVAGNGSVSAVAQWSANTLTVSVNNITGMSDGEYQTQINAVPNNDGTLAFAVTGCTGGSATVTSYGLVFYTAPHVTSQAQYTITVRVTATYPSGDTIAQDVNIMATIYSQDVIITNGPPAIESEPTEQGGYRIDDISYNGEDCTYIIAPQYTETNTENDLDGTLIKTLIGLLPILMILGIVVYVSRRMRVTPR